jgi:hypothetical protein
MLLANLFTQLFSSTGLSNGVKGGVSGELSEGRAGVEIQFAQLLGDAGAVVTGGSEQPLAPLENRVSASDFLPPDPDIAPLLYEGHAPSGNPLPPEGANVPADGKLMPPFSQGTPPAIQTPALPTEANSASSLSTPVIHVAVPSLAPQIVRPANASVTVEQTTTNDIRAEPDAPKKGAALPQSARLFAPAIPIPAATEPSIVEPADEIARNIAPVRAVIPPSDPAKVPDTQTPMQAALIKAAVAVSASDQPPANSGSGSQQAPNQHATNQQAPNQQAPNQQAPNQQFSEKQQSMPSGSPIVALAPVQTGEAAKVKPNTTTALPTRESPSAQSSSPLATVSSFPAQVSMIPQAAALAQNSIIAEAAPSLRDAQPLERLVETINQMRESGQLVRGEVSLRHSEFGMVAMRVSSVDGELQARLASRDPGFVNAAQMALNERQVLAASESNPTSSRQNDSSGAGQNPARDMHGSAYSEQHSSGTHQRAHEQTQNRADDRQAKGEHGAASLSADDHDGPNEVSVSRSADGLFA